MNDEVFDIIDVNGKVLGTAFRSEVHGNPDLIHKSVHCLVFNSQGDLYLQKRSENKDVQPNKWDTSVGGHVNSNESTKDAIKRETYEELFIKDVEFKFLYQYLMKSEIETELVETYMIIYDGCINFDTQEISEGKFWTTEDIEKTLNKQVFTPNFEDEWSRYKKVKNI